MTILQNVRSRAALLLEWIGRAVLRITKQDGTILTVSSWQAYRQTAALHMRLPCHACDGEGYQAWLIEGDSHRGEKSRWFPDYCKRCHGAGYVVR